MSQRKREAGNAGPGRSVESDRSVRRPSLAVNFAITCDGRVTTRNFTPSDFSSPEDKRRLLQIRATGDALLAGARTIAADNMSMGLPDAKLRAGRLRRNQSEYPLRVILSNSGNISPSLGLFAHDFSPVVIFSTHRMSRTRRAQLEKHATVHLSDTETVDLHQVLSTLQKDYHVKKVVCEGGPSLFRGLLEAGLVDEINLTLCPRVFGGTATPTLTGMPGGFLPKSMICSLAKMEIVGGECFLRYRVLLQKGETNLSASPV
jgi:riboflavin-specific deaminase-like protein